MMNNLGANRSQDAWNRRPGGRNLLAGMVLVLLGPVSVFGQLREQSFQLNPGWNTVFLEVNAVPDDADAIFGSLPIEAVWMRAPEPLSAIGGQCLGPDDPNCEAFDDTEWRVWVPPGPVADIVNTLRLVRGGNVYLIKAAKATPLTIVGMPSGFDPRYRPGYNLRGFYVVPNGAETPTVQAYLQPETTLAPDRVYLQQLDGSVALVAGTTQIDPGHGYWVSATRNVSFNGPLEVDRASLRGVDFGKTQLTHSMTIRNLTATSHDLRVQYLSSLTTVPAGFAGYAGDVPAHWLDFGGGSDAASILQWYPLGAHTVALPALTLQTPPLSLQIGVRRAGLTEALVDISRQGSLYQGLLEITDGVGFRRIIALSNEVIGAVTTTTAGGTSTDRPGLYLGTVRMTQVAWISAGARIWTNEDAANPQFAGLMKCSGGINDGDLCVPGRRHCLGTPEVDRTSIVCEADDLTVVACTSSDDCPLAGPCVGGFCGCPPGSTCQDDCPSGACRGFCIGGDNADAVCLEAVDCAGGKSGEDGVCSADLDNVSLRPVASEFEFPVIIHLSDTGEYKLLKDVTLLATADGRIVLATEECTPEVCDGLEGALTVNGEPFARRVSTAAFSFPGDLLFDSGGNFGTSLGAATTIAPSDPLNPFRHKFHPDHDCLDSFGNPLTGNALISECFQVDRLFVFGFESTPPDGRSELDWGDSVLGGVFTEQVEGLHKETITAQGRFELRRVSSIGRLNTPVDLGAQP